MRRHFVLLLTLSFVAGMRSFAQNPEPSPTVAGTPASPAATREAFAAAQGGYLEVPTPAVKMGYSSVNVEGPYLAMTFDDGPHITNTPRLLQMLAQRHIKATFFMVGQCAAEYPEIVKRVAAEGHEVANHSWSHPNFAKMSEEAVRAEISRTQQAIFAGCGVTPKIIRPPYGSITDRERKWITGDLGLKIIMWSVDPLDWKNRNAATVARRILAEAHPGSIILSHDIHATTIDAMPEVLDTLLARGMKFVTVSELLAMEKPVAPKAAKPASSPKADAPDIAHAQSTKVSAPKTGEPAR